MSKIIGDDAIVIGHIGENENIGNRAIRIGSTDRNGNVILRPASGGTAVGSNAQAGPNSIAIGNYAEAGVTESGTIINNVNGVQLNSPELNIKTSLI